MLGLGLALGCLALGCATAPAETVGPNFPSGLYTVLAYAEQEHGTDLRAADSLEVRVTLPNSLERYLSLDGSGLEGEAQEVFRRLVETIDTPVVVVSGLESTRDDAEGPMTIALVAIPEGSLPGFDGANAVLVSSLPNAGLCGIRSFGQKGSGKLCAYCAVGICCGTCRCTSCNTLTSATGGLDVPEPVGRLFEGPEDLATYPLDTDLLER